MRQTAVEWLLENLNSEPYSEEEFNYNSDCWDKAIEMEKEQIIDFAYVIADDLACGVFRDKKDMEKRYDEFLVFRSEEDESKNS
jgi:hypothetical protein